MYIQYYWRRITIGKTSSEVKNRWNAKHYTTMLISVDKDKAQRYKEKCKENGIPYSEPMKQAIDEYLQRDK